MSFICESNKYELGGVNNDVIGLPVFLENIPREISVKGETLYLPSPFHVSLIYIGKIIKKYDITIPDFIDKVVSDFCDFTKTNPVELTHYKDKFRFVNRDGTKKTVVVMCEVSNLNRFFDFINQKYKFKIMYPPTHITLYNTLKGQPGIYLMDENDIQNFTFHIKDPHKEDTRFSEIKNILARAKFN